MALRTTVINYANIIKWKHEVKPEDLLDEVSRILSRRPVVTSYCVEYSKDSKLYRRNARFRLAHTMWGDLVCMIYGEFQLPYYHYMDKSKEPITKLNPLLLLVPDELTKATVFTFNEFLSSPADIQSALDELNEKLYYGGLDR